MARILRDPLGELVAFPQTYIAGFKWDPLRQGGIGVDLTGILGEGRVAGQTIKVVCCKGEKHIFLHCNAINLVLKILQHDKTWGDNPPPLQILGGLVPRSPVIYAHAGREEDGAREGEGSEKEKGRVYGTGG